MSTLINERVELARLGENPTVICRVNSGWVVIGDVQFLRGYCVLLADPIVESINDLNQKKREQFFYEMSVIGDALINVTGCYRVNYGVLGNSEPALHAHIFPRFLDEEESKRRMPAWFYDWQNAPKFQKDKHSDLMDQIRDSLKLSGIVVE